jgi:microsomal dipeptidase-like Zn-dependent dipeptidase
MDLADLHVHPSLPWIGSLWRKRIQGFRPGILEGDAPRHLPAPEREAHHSAVPVPFRLYGAVFYQTHALRPDAARHRLFTSIKDFRKRLAARDGNLLLLSAGDTEAFRARASGNDAEAGASYGNEACFLAVESMRCLRDPGDVRRLWDCGVRSLQPIHFLDTAWGGSSREGMLPESRTGLTGLGREMLSEMGKLGLILDLAHMSRKNAEECLAGYAGPVMCSHTGLQSLNPSARNLTGELAKEIFRRDGIVGVTCWRHLLGPDPRRYPKPGMPGPGGLRMDSPRAAWTRAYCSTAAAFAALAPGARVAIGSDRGAPIRAPSWFYSPDHLAEMEIALASHGWDPERIRGFFSGHAWDFLARSLPA